MTLAIKQSIGHMLAEVLVYDNQDSTFKAWVGLDLNRAGLPGKYLAVFGSWFPSRNNPVHGNNPMQVAIRVSTGSAFSKSVQKQKDGYISAGQQSVDSLNSDTTEKVYRALRAAGCTDNQIQDWAAALPRTAGPYAPPKPPTQKKDQEAMLENALNRALEDTDPDGFTV